MIKFFIAIMSMTALQASPVSKENRAVPVKSIDSNNATYKLFPTQNMWTFIKLNTRNGQMWQVQFDVKEGNRHSSVLSSDTLVSKQSESNGRFTLYPTQNMYNFILLDQVDGRTWQVQWAFNVSSRLVIPIE